MQTNPPERQPRRSRSAAYGAEYTGQARQETSRYVVSGNNEAPYQPQPLSPEEIQRAQRAARRQTTMSIGGAETERRPVTHNQVTSGNPYASEAKPDVNLKPPKTRGKEKVLQESSKKPRVKAGVVLSIIVFAAIVALIVLVSPKEPLQRAYYSTGTEDGTTGMAAGAPSNEYEGLIISEIMPGNKTSVPDQDGNYPDWVEICNSSDHEISLKNVGLSDDAMSIRFLFPNMTIAAGERVIVFCDDTNQAEYGKPFHAKFKLSSVGETVYLYDPNAFLIDSVTYPIMSSDESYALVNGEWVTTKYFSPGYPNGEEGYNAYREETTVLNGDLIINEVMADAVTGLRDEDGDLVDWIELYNTTDHEILLDNYALSNKEGKPLKWRFPEGAKVAAKGYYLVFCSGKDRHDDATAIPHANFKISAEHDTIVLSDGRGRLMDRVTIDNLPRDCSYGRDGNGTFTVFNMGTPTLPNSQAGLNQMDYNMRQMNATGVYITEVMASNDSVTTLPNAGYTDWIEIYNSSVVTVDLSGYGLSDNLGRPRKWQFPQGTTIMPGEHKLILCDGKTAASTSAELHTSFKIKRAGGEIVCLSDPTGRVLDKLVLPEIPTNVSYGRTNGLAGFFYYDVPTPQLANSIEGFTGYAAQPSFSVDPGLYYSTVYVSVTIPENTTVYYTTDGSIPTRNSSIYNGETLEMNFTTVLRARAFSEEGLQPSTVTTGTFFINAYHTLPLVSLVVDPDELWNPTDGMLTAGDNVDKSGGIPFKNTVYREFGKVGRAANVEYYLLDGTTMLNQGAEIALQGQYSLDMPQKTFKLRAKSLYGSKTFASKLFPDREYTEYKSFVLRNSGNDCVWTRLQDGFQSRLLDYYGTTVIHQAWNPVAVYLNGVYWGHYNMRERVDRFFVAQHEGLPLSEADQMTIVEANGSAKYGSNKAYKNMIATIKKGDPKKNPADLQYILDNVDVDNYFEYIALEMFVGNSDIGNLRAYRLNKEGSKWKWIFYDADYGLFSSSFDSPASYLKSKGMGQQKIDNTILLKLLTVPEYKDKFLRKLGDIFQTFTTEAMLSVLEPLVEQIEPEMTLHFARWGEENDPAIIAEAPTTADGAYRYWETRINRLRNVLKKRPNLLWGYIQDAFALSNNEMVEYFGERPEMPPDAV